MSGSTTNSKGIRSKPPSLLACIPCRKSHLKCDGQKPLCRRCADRNGDCFWIESRRGYRDHRKAQAVCRVEEGRRGSNPRILGLVTDSCASDDLLEYEELFRSGLPKLPALDIQPLKEADLAGGSPGNKSDSTTSISRESQSLNGGSVTTESSDLLNLFYRYFFAAHPFVVPRKVALQSPDLLPEPVRAVMRFLGSHYVQHANKAALENAAGAVISDDIPDDGFKVQALLLYSILCYARSEQAKGVLALDKAIDIALRIGMNRQSFALRHGQNNPTLQESWRRTWWSLFIIDGLVTVIGGQEPVFRLYSAACDVLLPGSDEDYNEGQPSPLTRSLADMRNRTFSEDPYPYSSFAYAVEAACNLGSVLQLGPDSFAITDPQVEAIDASISSFLLSLPAAKREPVRPDGTVDECLLLAHLVINWASISLHRPRSTLTFIRNHYKTACTKPEAAGLPALAYAAHTAKAIRAANNITNLVTIQRPLGHSTPFLMCGVSAAATVHLPAFSIADRPDQAVAIRERLQLCVSALGSFGEIWPRAATVKGQVAQFARETLTNPGWCVGSPVAALPIGSDAVDAPTEIECEMPINNDVWMDTLLQDEVDESEDSAHRGFLVPFQVQE